MRTEAQRKARNKYRQKLVSVGVEFSLKESDLAAHIMKQPNKARYIKGLIRADMARQKEGSE